MLAVADQAWGMPPQGALRLDDIPPADAPWEQIAEFAHTFNGYAHFGEGWGEQFNAVRERYFETEELPDDVDGLRAACSASSGWIVFRGATTSPSARPMPKVCVTLSTTQTSRARRRSVTAALSWIGCANCWLSGRN